MIIRFIQMLGDDKKDHAISGILGCFVVLGALIVGHFFESKVLFSNIAGIVLMLGYAYKEIVYDGLQGKGNKEFADWFWNSLPILLMLAGINLMKLL